MKRVGTRTERRQWIEAALTEDAARSDRSIARACGASHSTVSAVRRELELAGRIDRRPDRPDVDRQATVVNLVRQPAGVPSPALKHGVDSEQRLAPLRARFEVSLRGEFGFVDDRRLFLLADLLARIEAARVWVDERGGVVRNRSGDVFPVVDRLETWGRRADAALRDLGAEKREREALDPGQELTAHLAELEAGDATETHASQSGAGVNGDRS